MTSALADLTYSGIIVGYAAWDDQLNPPFPRLLYCEYRDDREFCSRVPAFRVTVGGFATGRQHFRINAAAVVMNPKVKTAIAACVRCCWLGQFHPLHLQSWQRNKSAKRI